MYLILYFFSNSFTMAGHRNCAMFGCGNSGARLTKWMDKQCSIHNCNQGTSYCDCSPPFRLFPFPTEAKDSEARQSWIKLVNRKGKKGKIWQPNNNSRVCSDHFPDAQPTPQNPHPTLNLGYNATSSTKTCRKRPAVRDSSKPIARKKLLLYYNSPTPQEIVEMQSDVTGSNNDKEESSSSLDTVSEMPCSDINSAKFTCGNAECQNIVSEKDIEIANLKKMVEKGRREVAMWRKKYVEKEPRKFSTRDLNTDKKLKTFLGIPNKQAFNALFSLIEKKAPKLSYWKGPAKHNLKGRKFSSTPQKSGPRRKLSAKDEFIMTLMKLRLGSLNADLALRFGVSETTVSKVINTWVRFLAKEFKCMIFNPPKGTA